MAKISSGDLEGGWQSPTPDQGLESFYSFQVRILLLFFCEHNAWSVLFVPACL